MTNKKTSKKTKLINPRTAKAGDRVWDKNSGEVELTSKPRRVAGGYAVDLKVPQDRLDRGDWPGTITYWVGACCNLYDLLPGNERA